MDRLRILFFLNSVVRGGVEEVVLSLVKGLDRERFDVHLAAPRALLHSLAPDLNGRPVNTVELYLTSWKQWSDMARFIGYLRQNEIQIVNTHLFRSTLFAAPLARLAGVPVVVETTHGPEAWRRSWWKRKCWVDRWIEKFVTLNIAVSEANRDYLVTRKRYPANKIRVVPNGRELAEYGEASDEKLQLLRRRYGLWEDDRIVIVVGRLEEQKGHAHLFAALPVVVKRLPALKVILVGDGSLRLRLEDLARKNRLGRHVIFAGFNAEVAPFYHLAEFVVLPSLYEGMPLVAIEAAAAGKTVVATDVGGTREVVVAGCTGLLVPPGSAEALSGAILQLLADPENTQRMGRAARARMQRVFPVNRQIQLTSQIYQTCWAGAR